MAISTMFRTILLEQAQKQLMRPIAPICFLGIMALSACAVPARMHSEAQLNEVALGCGLAMGELIQDDSQKKLLLTIHQHASPEQRICIAHWARRNGLRAVFVNMNFPQEPST